MGHGLEQISRDLSIAIIIALLLHIEVIDSTESLQLVIMEWLSETYCTLNQLPFDQLHSVVPTIQLAWQSADGILVHGQRFAYGAAQCMQKPRRAAMEVEVLD